MADEHTTQTPTPDRALAEDGRFDITGLGTSQRRGVRWLAVVATVFLVTEVIARVVVAGVPEEVRWFDASMQLRVEMIDELVDTAPPGEPAVDVVFAGPSSAWQAMVPAVFESASARTALNVGVDGGVPPVTGPWLIDHVAPRLRPDLVVWGLTPLDLAPAFGDQPGAAYEQAIAARTDWMADLDRAASGVSRLVEARRILRDPSALFGDRADEREGDLERAQSVTGTGGERLDFEPDLSEAQARVMRARLGGFEIDEGDRDLIVQTIEALRQRGTDVVLVELPMPQRFRDLLPNPDRDGELVASALAEIADRTGAGLIRMPRALSDIDFVDYSHVDAPAAAKVSTWVAEGLALLESLDADECGDLGLVDDFGFAVPVSVCSAASG